MELDLSISSPKIFPQEFSLPNLLFNIFMFALIQDFIVSRLKEHHKVTFLTFVMILVYFPVEISEHSPPIKLWHTIILLL
jgi:hypothetical protein